VETTECAHCGAELPPAAGFCRACDTPVDGAHSGRLSVAELVPEPPRRRAPVVLGVLALVAALGGATYGAVHVARSSQARSTDQAADDARRALTLLVRAEGGRIGACRKAAPYLAGVRHDEVQDCLAVVGSDRGASLEDVEVGAPRLASPTGTVEVTGTLVDDTGTRAFDSTVHLVEQSGHWLIAWDGHGPA